MERTTIALGIIAALVHGIAYLIYNIQTKLGNSKPNPATWTIWALLATINAFSYKEMSGDTVVTLQFFMSSTACTITFFYVLAIGKFSLPNRGDWIALSLGISAVFVWWRFKTATGANLLILIAALISFIPTLVGVIENPSVETSLPWKLWTFAYSITIINIVLRWRGQTITLVPPILLLIAHSTVAVLCMEKRKNKYNEKGAS